MLRRAIAQKPLDPATIAIGTETMPVMFRRHPHARRLVLRLNSEATAVIVTVPGGVSRNQALAFTERSRGWIEERVKSRGVNIPLRPGSRIPLRGVDHDIRHVASRRGTVTVDTTAFVIHVPGELPHVPRRLQDWLKSVARAELTTAAQHYAAAMEVKFRRITVRDQSSRWGSCSAGGDLSFSWRLILTPPHVLDYVAAHEVAHLKHMDHGPRFWRLVLRHCPEAARAKSWLKAHGQETHRIVM